MTIRSESGPSPEQVELARILQLPVKPDIYGDPEGVEVYNIENLLAEALDRGERFVPEQVAAMQAIRELGAALCPLGVGTGKTGIAICAVEDHYREHGQPSLLLMPPGLIMGFMHRHVPEWRKRVNISVPFLVLGGRSAKLRKSMAESGAVGCYVMPYSLLSRPDSLDLLFALNPTLVVADEAHRLKHRTSARTKRLLSFILDTEASPPRQRARFIPLSGSLTKRSLRDYHHLAELSLGSGSPLPRSWHMVETWDIALNADAQAPDSRTEYSLGPLLKWAEASTDEKFDATQLESYRRAYKHRVNTAPGIVSTGDKRITASLLIQNVASPPYHPDQLEMIRKVMEDYVTPNGDEIDHAMHRWSWLYQLSSGFYQELTWPSPMLLSERRGISLDEAEMCIERAMFHHEKLQEYHRLLRSYFRHSPAGLDTPREVGRAAHQNDPRLPKEIKDAWKAVKDADFQHRPEREEKAVRVSDNRIQLAIDATRHLLEEEKDAGVVVYYYHREIGRWLDEGFRKAGLDPLFCPAGPEAAKAIEDEGDPVRGGRGKRIVVASISAHGEGRNLHAFHRSIVTQWPRDCGVVEQLLGRQHRRGQEADEVRVVTLLSTDHERQTMAATLNDAAYVQQTTGADQLLLLCDWDPLPQIFPPEFLRELGLSPRSLSPEQKEMLKSRFGHQVNES